MPPARTCALCPAHGHTMVFGVPNGFPSVGQRDVGSVASLPSKRINGHQNRIAGGSSPLPDFHLERGGDAKSGGVHSAKGRKTSRSAGEELWILMAHLRLLAATCGRIGVPQVRALYFKKLITGLGQFSVDISLSGFCHISFP